MKILLEHSADVHQPTKVGEMPLFAACTSKAKECVNLLLAANAHVDGCCASPSCFTRGCARQLLFQAFKSGSTRRVRELLACGTTIDQFTHQEYIEAARGGEEGGADRIRCLQLIEKSLFRRAKCALTSCNAIECRGVSFQLCGRCKEVAYCCPEHQKKHWKEHKTVCCEPSERRERARRALEERLRPDEKAFLQLRPEERPCLHREAVIADDQKLFRQLVVGEATCCSFTSSRVASITADLL